MTPREKKYHLRNNAVKYMHRMGNLAKVLTGLHILEKTLQQRNVNWDKYRSGGPAMVGEDNNPEFVIAP
jgi:hypothetical protein